MQWPQLRLERRGRRQVLEVEVEPGASRRRLAIRRGHGALGCVQQQVAQEVRPLGQLVMAQTGLEVSLLVVILTFEAVMVVLQAAAEPMMNLRLVL